MSTTYYTVCEGRLLLVHAYTAVDKVVHRDLLFETSVYTR